MHRRSTAAGPLPRAPRVGGARDRPGGRIHRGRATRRLAERATAAAAAQTPRRFSGIPDPLPGQRPAGRLRRAPRAARGQRADDPARRRRDRSARSAGRRFARRTASRPGDEHPLRPGNRRRHRQHRRRAERRYGPRPRVHRRPGDEGQLRLCARPARRRGAAAGLRAGGDRAAAQPGAVGPAGQLRRSGVHRQRGLQPPGLRVSPLRPAAGRHAAVDRHDHAGRPGGVPSHALPSQQRRAGRRRETSRRKRRSPGWSARSATGSRARRRRQ